MADIHLTSGSDDYTQSEAEKNLNNTVYGEAGNDTIRMYQGAAFGSHGNDRIERIIDPANPNRGLTAAYWDAATGIVVNLAEGWAEDGHGGRDTLIGVTGVLGNSTDDRVIGDARDNSFGGNHGHDYFDGADGIDTADLWFSVAGQSFGVARLDDVDIRVSADGQNAKITPKAATNFSLTLVNVERIGVTGADGQRVTVNLADFISPQSLAEDSIAAGGAMRWNAAQALGTEITLTFSFVTQDTQPGFRAFSPAEQQAARDILAATAALAGLTFTEVAEGAGTIGQLRFGTSQQAASKGRAAVPGTHGELAGDVWMDVETMANLTPGSEGYAALLHEIGHALGLRHPRNTDPGESWPMQMREQDDRPGWTVMSSAPSADGLFRADWGALDVIALRYLYGTRMAATGDNSYVLGTRESAAQVTLVDDGGADTLDASSMPSSVNLDLVPGHLGSAGLTSAGFAGVENLGIAMGTVIEIAIGSPFDDVLIGNDVANALTGGLGNDWIDGGAGTDRAVFAGKRADYLLTNSFGKLFVEARDGVGGFDTVASIETLVFADQSVALAAAALGADAEFSVDEDRSISASLPDPSDVVRATAHYRLVGNALHGSAQVSADGQLIYTPSANYYGSDQVAFELSSGANSNVYLAFVNVRPVNDGAPVAKDVTLLAPAGATLRGSLPLATDVDLDPITYAATAAAANGDAVVAADGSFSYTAKAGFTGTDTFNFIVGDGMGGTNTYAAAVQVLPVTATRSGTGKNDTLVGGSAADGLLALEGNDRITGGGGDDLIDGGAGIDTSVFGAGRAKYQLSKAAFGWTVKDSRGVDGTDSLAGIERLAFSDGGLALDLDGHAGSVAQIIRALFGKGQLANKTFVGIGLTLFDADMSYAEVVKFAVETEVFAQLAGGRSNTAFVNFVYKNVIGLAPGAADLAAYVGLLDAGVYTQDALALLACQSGLNVDSVELIGLTKTGIEFTQPPG